MLSMPYSACRRANAATTPQSTLNTFSTPLYLSSTDFNVSSTKCFCMDKCRCSFSVEQKFLWWKIQKATKAIWIIIEAFTIAPIISKIFEHVFWIVFQPFLSTSSYQFGFKKKSSTSLAIQCLKETINYYTSNGSSFWTHQRRLIALFMQAFSWSSYNARCRWYSWTSTGIPIFAAEFVGARPSVNGSA